VRVIYGGSVNLDNCVALSAQAHVDGLFIGRSAWELEGFLAIVRRVLRSRREAGRGGPDPEGRAGR
jgi:triosephosphate isomerase